MNIFLLSVLIAVLVIVPWHQIVQWRRAGKPVSLTLDAKTIRNLLVIFSGSLLFAITSYQLLIYSASVQVSMLSGIFIGLAIMVTGVLRELTSKVAQTNAEKSATYTS